MTLCPLTLRQLQAQNISPLDITLLAWHQKHMTRLILRRLMTAIPTLLAIIIMSFLLMRFAPGGPFDGELPLAAETRAALESAYGLDKSLGEQLLLYLGRLVQGDFGPSLVYRDFTVTELIAQSLPVSLLLGALALMLASFWV